MRLPDTPAFSVGRRIIARLREQGHSAYLVGGCVRDILLSVESKDVDIATSATPAQVRQLYPEASLVGAKFGVVLVREAGIQAEIATYRSDHSCSDGRRPESVAFETDPRRDVQRRDFTINAMLMDPDSGELLDYVDGCGDLKRKLIRTVGDPAARFAEDYLRMLRAVRFAARFGFTIEPATLAAIQGAAPAITRVAAERTRGELIRILSEGGARHGFELLDTSGLLPHVLPEVADMKGVQQPLQFHPEGDVWIHTLMMLEHLRDPTPTLALGVLLHDVGKPPTFRQAERIRFDGHARIGAEMAVRILRRLRCSSDHIQQVESLVANHLRFMHAHEMKASTLKRFMRLERFEEHLELHRLDCLASHGALDNYDLVKARYEALEPEELNPEPLLTGHDLIRAGFSPGVEFGRVLRRVETAQLDGAVTTHEEALELARSLLESPES